MAKSKKNNVGNAFALIAILILIMLVIIALLTPMVIFFGYFYNKIKSGKIKKELSGLMSDFWLNENEKNDFKENTEALINVNNIIQKANEDGISAGISINKNGSFSAKSNLGKRIRATLDKYEPIRDSLKNHLSGLQNLPVSRWNQFNSYLVNEKSFMISFFSWFFVLLYKFIISDKKSVLDTVLPYLALSTNIFRDEQNKIALSDGDIQMVAVATVASLLTYAVSRFVFKNEGEKYSPRPDFVTLDNIDSY